MHDRWSPSIENFHICLKQSVFIVFYIRSSSQPNCYCSFAAQPNPYAAAPQHTHKMKDRSTVTTTTTPLPTATVPSSPAQNTQKPTAPASSAIPIVADTKQASNKAINDSNGVSTSSQTAKPTTKPPVTVPTPDKSSDKTETSNVEPNTKGNSLIFDLKGTARQSWLHSWKEESARSANVSSFGAGGANVKMSNPYFYYSIMETIAVKFISKIQMHLIRLLTHISEAGQLHILKSWTRIWYQDLITIRFYWIGADVDVNLGSNLFIHETQNGCKQLTMIWPQLDALQTIISPLDRIWKVIFGVLSIGVSGRAIKRDQSNFFARFLGRRRILIRPFDSIFDINTLCTDRFFYIFILR